MRKVIKVVFVGAFELFLKFCLFLDSIEQSKQETYIQLKPLLSGSNVGVILSWQKGNKREGNVEVFVRSFRDDNSKRYDIDFLNKKGDIVHRIQDCRGGDYAYFWISYANAKSITAISDQASIKKVPHAA